MGRVVLTVWAGSHRVFRDATGYAEGGPAPHSPVSWSNGKGGMDMEDRRVDARSGLFRRGLSGAVSNRRGRGGTSKSTP